MTAELEHLLDQVPRLARRVLVEELSGGLTNRNYRVVTPDGDYVVRWSGSDADLLGIDRDAEQANSRCAFEAGVGAPVHDYRPDLGVLVIGYLTGTSLENDSFADAGRARPGRRRLPPAARRSSFRRRVRHVRATGGVPADGAGAGVPAASGVRDHADAWAAVQRAVAARPRVTVPCNNDLLAGNFIDDGDRVWLIDYEYSGNNDVAFELGNTCTECEFPRERVEAYAEAYYGSLTRGDLARVRLGALRSEYGWALWGFIQAASSPLDFDFHDWGMHRFEKAARTFTSDGFDRLLEEAVGD